MILDLSSLNTTTDYYINPWLHLYTAFIAARAFSHVCTFQGNLLLSNLILEWAFIDYVAFFWVLYNASLQTKKLERTRNVGQCPTWWPPCRISVAPSVQRRSLADVYYTRVPCSNGAMTRNPLKLPGVPQTNETISVASGRSSPYCEDMWRRYCCLTIFFPIVDSCLICEDIARQSCAMVPRWRFLATFLHPVIAVSREQHISDLHSKFALGPHHVSKYGRHPTCGRWD